MKNLIFLLSTLLIVVMVAISLQSPGEKQIMFEKPTYLDCLVQNQITLRIGYLQIEPTAKMGNQIRAAVVENNQKARLESLNDDLNPEILDLTKVEAFLQGLPNLTDEVLNQLKGRVLYLNTPTLRLGTAVAISSKRFAAALVWRDNSQLLVEVNPTNQLFKQELIEAKKAALEYTAPSWIGLPS